MKHVFPVSALAFLSVLIPGYSKDDRPPISTDRPGVFFSSDTVPWGAFQLETGLEYMGFRLQESTQRTATDLFGTPLALRIGLFENFELRINSFGFTHLNNDIRGEGTIRGEASESGLSSPSFGFKWQLIGPEEGVRRPLLGFIFSLDLPIGTRSFRPEKSVFSSTALVDVPLPNEFFLVFNAGWALPYDGDTEERFLQGLGAVALGRSLSPTTSFFLEIAALGPQSDGGEAEALVDGGLLFLLGDRLQLDVALSRGITRLSTDWGATVGLSFYLF